MSSLSTRITIWVVLLLAACGLVAGAALHRALRQAADAQLRGWLDARLAWLEGALDVEMDDGEVQLEVREEPAGAAQAWEVADVSGRVLWSGGALAAENSISLSKMVTFGPPSAPALQGSSLLPEGAAPQRTRPAWGRITIERVPPAVLAAARAQHPDLEVVDAWQRTRIKKKDKDAPPTFELRGSAGEREYELRIDATGRVLSVKHQQASAFSEYQFLAGDERRLDLMLRARASTVASDAELAASARILWTVGPLALAVTGLLLALAIRWQLRPLSRMAAQAATISPADVAEAGGQIDAPGTATELVRLRTALNAMLLRLGQAMHRERRFAATAAHELRTPLAQMRLSVDVALRRQRDAAEYQQALGEISGDIARLERLVSALLQLARAGDSGALAQRDQSVDLAPLLARVILSRGPAHFNPADAADSLWIAGDAELLSAALGNVLENAARYASREPPTIRISRGRDANGEQVEVIIADRGPGIPPADRDRIFEPLTRLEQANEPGRSRSDGLGLGLAVARQAARAAGGDLICRGRADGAAGAEFVFRFRRARVVE